MTLMIRASRALRLSLALGLIVAWGCESDLPDPGQGAPSSFELEDSVPPALVSIPVEAVQGRTGPGDEPFYVALRTPEGSRYLYRRIGTELFALPLRLEPELSQYPCTSCHEGQDVEPGGEREEEEVHQNIQPVHPEETGADCGTCHSRDDVARLQLEIGETVSLDHAYRLCAQCHSREVDDWAKGAHGKRLVAWRGRRVVMNCTDCHSPHEPTTVKRIPYPGPEIPRTGEAQDYLGTGEPPEDSGPGGEHQ